MTRANGCPGWRPVLDGSYLLDDIRDRLKIPHETGEPA